MHKSFEQKSNQYLKSLCLNRITITTVYVTKHYVGYDLGYQLVSCLKTVENSIWKSTDTTLYVSAAQAVILQTTAPSNMLSSFHVAAVAVALSIVYTIHKVVSHSLLFIYCV